ncbi:hypothetical protein [Sinomonas gamaensis]|uniref:hypothetical protein n=1 Tax=Sinomonas gamaensis TaxID=2565624 RepID=UPI00110A05F9|nr:hypothetical protein [Sinomonas gamaensis]
MVSISPAAAMVRLRPGDVFALSSGTDTREGTVLTVDLRGIIRFRDGATGKTLMADLAHWDAVQVPARLRAAS